MIGIAGYRPVTSIYGHMRRRSDDRVITYLSEQESDNIRKTLILNLVIITALFALSIFIFTPTAEKFAHSSSFIPSLLGLFGIVILYFLSRSFISGELTPLVRGSFGPYRRDSHPKRFWASASWNGALGIMCLGGSIMMFKDAPIAALKARCHDYENAHSPKAELEACNQLIRDYYAADAVPADLIAARGNAYLRLGEYPDAKLDYTDAIRRDPGISSTWYNRGLANESLGISQRAISDYGMAIELDSENTDAYLRRGLLFLNNGQFDRAITDFTDLSTLRPDDAATALANRGVAHAWKKNAALARQDFNAALAKDPANIIVMRGNAILSLQDGDLNAAKDHLTAALAREPDDAWSLHQRSWVYGKLGEAEKAKTDADRLAKLMRRAEERQ